MAKLLKQNIPFIVKLNKTSRIWHIVLCLLLLVLNFFVARYISEISIKNGLAILLSTFLVGAFLTHFNHRLIKIFLYKNKNWNFQKEIVWLLFNALIINAIAVLLGLRFGVLFTIQLKLDFISIIIFNTNLYFLLLYLIKNTQTISASINSAYELNNLLLKYHKNTTETDNQKKEEVVNIKSENEKESVQVAVEQLLYILASSNYIEVFWQEGNECKKRLIRNTLKNIEESFKPYQEIFRCHRSALVNLKKVSSILGNSQGYKLRFPNDALVNVSRQKSNELKELLHK